MATAKKAAKKATRKRTPKKAASKPSRSLSKREAKVLDAVDINGVSRPLKDALEAIEPHLVSMLPSDLPENKIREGLRHNMRINERYTRNNVLTCLRLAALGIEQNFMAALIGVHAQQITNWKKDHPEFSLAMDQARGMCQLTLLGKVYEGIPKNPRLAFDLLQTQFPEAFASVKRHDHSGNVNVSHKAVSYLENLGSEWALPDEPSSTQGGTPSGEIIEAQVVTEAESIEETPLPTETAYKSTETGGKDASE